MILRPRRYLYSVENLNIFMSQLVFHPFYYLLKIMFSHKLAISTISLGQHPSHTLDRKIKASALAGYSGIELVFSDLESYSRTNGLSIIGATKRIKKLCDSLKVEIISLAPFENYEGDRSPLSQRLQTATL